MEEKKSRYSCAECGVAVIVYEGVIHRPCPHEDAAVIAECYATAYGKSSMEAKQCQ